MSLWLYRFDRIVENRSRSQNLAIWTDKSCNFDISKPGISKILIFEIFDIKKFAGKETREMHLLDVSRSKWPKRPLLRFAR